MLGDYKEDSNSTLFFVIAGLIHIGLFFAFLGHQQPSPELEPMGSEDTITIEVDPSWGEQTEVEQWALEENQTKEEALPATDESTSEKVDEVAKTPDLPKEEEVIEKKVTPEVVKAPPVEVAKKPDPQKAVVKKLEALSPKKAPLVLGEEQLPPENVGGLIADEALAEESFAEELTPNPKDLFAHEESTDTPSFEDSTASEDFTPLPTETASDSSDDSFDDVIADAKPVPEPEAQMGDEVTGTEGRSSIQTYGVPEGVRDYRSLSQRPGNVRPSYDKEDRLKRREGQVNFLAYVLPNGSLTDFRMKKSSGHRSLDYKALKTVKNWKFVAGQEGWVEIPILWSLKGEAQQITAPLRRGISKN